jgi:hypothetical protein
VLLQENATVKARLLPHQALVPTRNGDTPLLAAQRRRYA